jgi:predicted metal-dependent peptidase
LNCIKIQKEQLKHVVLHFVMEHVEEEEEEEEKGGGTDNGI